MTVEAATPDDERLAERIEAELRAYEQGFDLESMPTAQADQLAPVVNNLPQAAGGVDILRVDSGRVEAVTGFPDDEEGEVTGRLICGAIERAGARDGLVLGADDSMLAECRPDDRNFP